MIVIPIYNTIIAPNATLFFPTEDLKQSAGGKGLSLNEKLVLIVGKEKKALTNPSEDSFYPVGVSGSITELNPQGYTVIRTQYRVNLEDVHINPDGTVQLNIQKRIRKTAGTEAGDAPVLFRFQMGGNRRVFHRTDSLCRNGRLCDVSPA